MPGLLFSGANAALVAYGSVAVSGGVATTVIDGDNTTAGQVVVARTGAGVFTLTLPTGYGQARSRSMVYCAPRTSAAVFISVDDTASQVKTVRTFNSGGSATDEDFSFMIFENTEPKPVA